MVEINRNNRFTRRDTDPYKRSKDRKERRKDRDNIQRI